MVGCSTSAAAPSFDASAPCTADTKVAGAYPALEAHIPATIGGTARISARLGSKLLGANLGTLAGHGLSEVQFAGGVWQDSAQSG